MTDDECARSCLTKLVEHILRSAPEGPKTLFYSNLAERIGRIRRESSVPFSRGMGRILGKLGDRLEKIETELGAEIPKIQSLVVSKTGKSKGYPGEGIKKFWPDYETLSKAQKDARLKEEHAKIAAFGNRWNEVIRIYNLRYPN